MKRYILILFVLICIWLSWCSFFQNNEQSIWDQKSNVGKIIGSDKSVWEQLYTKEFIMSWFDEELHHLDLSRKSLNNIPDLCNILTWDDVIDNISSIDLSDNKIDVVDINLSCLGNLTELNLSYNNILSIKKLILVDNIKLLRIHKNQLSSVNWINQLVNLHELNLGYNNLKDVSALWWLKKLEVLELQHNSIDSIDWLENLWNLIVLKLEYNAISDVSKLLNLPKLQKLTVGENKLDDSVVNMINSKYKNR